MHTSTYKKHTQACFAGLVLPTDCSPLGWYIVMKGSKYPLVTFPYLVVACTHTRCVHIEAGMTVGIVDTVDTADTADIVVPIRAERLVLRQDSESQL
jgi:hypothetical protein